MYAAHVGGGTYDSFKIVRLSKEFNAHV